MINKTNHFILPLVLSLFVVSCATYYPSKQREVSTNITVFSEPLIVEVDSVSSERISFSYTFRLYDNADYKEGKQKTVNYCCAQFGYDALANVEYYVEELKKEKSVRIHITGFPVWFKRIRPATRDDVWMLNFIDSYDLQQLRQNSRENAYEVKNSEPLKVIR